MLSRSMLLKLSALMFAVGLGLLFLPQDGARPIKPAGACGETLGVFRAGPCGTTAYSGPGDVVSGASAWWGLRAYSSATKGNRIANICNSTGGVDVACADISSDSTTGALAPATIGGITCPGANCTVKVLYDQTGNGVDLTQTTIANRPALTASCIGALPCMTGNGSSTQISNLGAAPSLSQPITISSVANNTGGAGSEAAITGIAGGGITQRFRFDSDVGVYAGAFLTAAAATGTWFSVTCVVNSASSDDVINGTSNTGDAGANAGASNIYLFDDSFGAPLAGKVTEAGWWPSGFSAGNKTAMSANQRAYWAF